VHNIILSNVSKLIKIKSHKGKKKIFLQKLNNNRNFKLFTMNKLDNNPANSISNIRQLVENQKLFFNSNKTKDIKFRKLQLTILFNCLKKNESLIYDAIYKDFRKSKFDTYETELSLIYHEIKLAIKNLPKWSKTKKVSTGIANFPGRSYIMPEPLGVTLVIGAWNYPYQLSILPAVSAIVAGNTVIIKPSELSENSSKIMAEILNAAFAEEFLHVVEGGVEVSTELLKQKFDKIFFTGSSAIGKIIMKAASENLCPVVLELGGKSPAFILDDASIKIAAKRIVFGKFINGGQTCVAPDYLIIRKGIKEKFIEELKKQIRHIHGDNPSESEAFTNIINQRHFERLINLINDKKVVFGGEHDENKKYISPTLLDNVNWDDAIMQEEIFGPILPIIEFDDLDEIIKKVKQRDKPLALYIFSNCTKAIDKITKEISFGGGMINDTLAHLANANLPFGGVGYSGMGNYHGKFGFDAFSHQKAVLYKSNLIEPFIKYPPYTKTKLRILKWLLE